MWLPHFAPTVHWNKIQIFASLIEHANGANVWWGKRPETLLAFRKAASFPEKVRKWILNPPMEWYLQGFVLFTDLLWGREQY